MPLFWIFFAFLHLVSVFFMLLALQRLYSYIRRYKFNESHYTLLFGCVHLHWITKIYIGLVSVWVIFSYLLIVR